MAKDIKDYQEFDINNLVAAKRDLFAKEIEGMSEDEAKAYLRKRRPEMLFKVVSAQEKVKKTLNSLKDIESVDKVSQEEAMKRLGEKYPEAVKLAGDIGMKMEQLNQLLDKIKTSNESNMAQRKTVIDRH